MLGQTLLQFPHGHTKFLSFFPFLVCSYNSFHFHPRILGFQIGLTDVWVSLDYLPRRKWLVIKHNPLNFQWTVITLFSRLNYHFYYNQCWSVRKAKSIMSLSFFPVRRDSPLTMTHGDSQNPKPTTPTHHQQEDSCQTTSGECFLSSQSLQHEAMRNNSKGKHHQER